MNINELTVRTQTILRILNISSIEEMSVFPFENLRGKTIGRSFPFYQGVRVTDKIIKEINHYGVLYREV